MVKKLISDFSTKTLIVFLVPVLFSFGARASRFGFSKDSLNTYFETSYYLTKANYDAFGNYGPLNSGNQFSEWRFVLSGSYDFSNKFGVYAMGSFKRTDAIINTGFLGTAGLSETTDTNFSDFTVGANYLLFSRGINLIPDISLLIPAYGQAGTVNGPLLGDGAFVVTAKMHVTKKLSSVLFDAFGGYSYRSYGFSSLIPYGGLVHFDTGSTIFLEGAVNGTISLNNDQYQANPLYRLAYANAFDAGSLVYDATDPSWLNGDLTLGIRFSPETFMTVGIEQSLVGYSTSQGTRFLVGFGYGTNPTRLSRSHGGIGDDSRGSENFEVDTDAEDEAAKPKRARGTPVQERSPSQDKIVAPVQ